jgi:hypothetical protein
MTVAGSLVMRRNRYIHFHLLGHHHEEARSMGTSLSVLGKTHNEAHVPDASPPPAAWTLLHGFIAGFGFGGFSIFVNTVAAPAMRSPWLGFLPGLVYGLGTMIVIAAVGALFGASLRLARTLSVSEIKRIGAQTAGKTLFFGGFFFAAFGVLTLLGWDRFLPSDSGYLLVGLFLAGIALPAFFLTWKRVRAEKNQTRVV